MTQYIIAVSSHGNWEHEHTDTSCNALEMAVKYGRANDTVTVYDEDGAIVARAEWSVEDRAYIEVEV